VVSFYTASKVEPRYNDRGILPAKRSCKKQTLALPVPPIVFPRLGYRNRKKRRQDKVSKSTLRLKSIIVVDVENARAREAREVAGKRVT